MTDYFLLGVTGDPYSREPVVFGGEGHTVSPAPPGKGKSQSVCGPNLIMREGASSIVTDFKGDMAKKYALYQSAVLGISTFVFDPFKVVPEDRLPHERKEMNNVDSTTAALPGEVVRGHADPIDFIRESNFPVTSSHLVSEAFIPTNPNAKEQFWDDGARGFCSASLLFVAKCKLFEQLLEFPEQLFPNLAPKVLGRNMTTFWAILSNKKAEEAAVCLMAASDIALVSDYGNLFFDASPDEGTRGIRNHLRTNLSQTLSEPGILDTLTGTNVDFEDFAKSPHAAFFVLPGQMAQTYFRFTRLLNVMAIAGIEKAGERKQNDTRPYIHFDVDEAATLGKFQPMVDAMARMRSYGVRFHVYIQALSQLKALYGDDVFSILGSADVIQFFGGTNCEFTANYISMLSGIKTQVVVGGTSPNGPGQYGSTSQNVDGRKLYMPDEVMRLPMPKQLIKLTGFNMTEAVLFPPTLEDFPRYRAFMAALECGATPERAAALCMREREMFEPCYRDRPVPPPPPPPKPKTLIQMLDDWLTNYMGHEKE